MCFILLKFFFPFVSSSNIRHGDEIVGIDLGTANSRLAFMEAQVGLPTLICNFCTFPSTIILCLVFDVALIMIKKTHLPFLSKKTTTKTM